MAAAAPGYTTYEDYLVAGEASSDIKHEWCDGVMYAMSRGTPEHGRLCANVIHAVCNAMPKECSVYASGTMIYVEAARLSTYADASVVCGALETKRVVKNRRSLGEAVTNPTVIIEVLSEATERYDRDGKFQAYKLLTSLREYVLVSQDDRRIEVYHLEGGRWICEIGERSQTITIHGQPIAVDSVYD